MPRRRRRKPVITSPPATRPLTVVVIAHVDTGPLWYQWIARAGHEAWLWYAADAPAGPERLVQETSPDVLLVHAASADDPGWMQVQEVRRRFIKAGLKTPLSPLLVDADSSRRV